MAAKDYTGQHHWLELDNNPSDKYLDLFLGQNIVWQRITHANIFCLTDNNMVILDSMAFISCDKNYRNWLLGLLNSNIMTFYLRSITPAYGAEGFRLSNQFLELVPIPKMVENVVDKYVASLSGEFKTDIYNSLNALIAKFYNLTDLEYRYIADKYTIIH